MLKPNSFTLATDFATLRNDDSGTTSLVMPGSAILFTSGQITADITVGAPASSTRVRLNSSRDPNTWLLANGVALNRTGTFVSDGLPAPYTLYVNTYRTSPTVLRLDASLQNPYSETIYTQSGDETITIVVKTLILPFS